MFNNSSNGSIISISDADLDNMFADSPDTTVTANMLNNTIKPNDVILGGNDGETDLFQPKSGGDIPQIDFDAIEAAEGAAPEIKDEPKEEENKDKVVTEKKKDEPEEEVVVPETAEVKTALKNTVNYLVETGLWKDFEGRDDMEIDSETYAKLSAEQDKERLNEKFGELVESTGEYGKAIIEHIKNGGNPEEVLDIFQEKTELQTFDKSTQQGKLDYMYTYYTEIVGMDEDQAKKYLSALLKDESPDESIAQELTKVEAKFEAHYKTRLAEVERKTIEAKQDNIKKQEAFVSNIKGALEKEELTPKEKRLIEDSITKFKNKLPNGAVVNDFYIKFAEKQNDPAEYVKLVQFILDREGYEKKVALKDSSKKAQEKFNFTVNNKKTSGIASKSLERDEDPNDKLDFSVIFKNKY